MGYRHWAVVNELSDTLPDSCRVISVFLLYDFHSLIRRWLTWHKCSTMLDTSVFVVTVSPEQMFPKSWQASETFVSGCFGVASGLVRFISCLSSYLYEKTLELILFHKKDYSRLCFFSFFFFFIYYEDNLLQVFGVCFFFLFTTNML